MEVEGEMLLVELQPPAPVVETLPRLQGERESVNTSYGEFFPQDALDAPDMQRHRKTLHWLLYVVLVTAALLVFQVVAGLCTNSLALLADSSHSALDVITYGLNYCVEKWKVRHRGYDDMNTESCVTKVDLVGGIVSTLTLIAATALAVHEAIMRLWGESPAEEDDFDNIGEVLLVFAVVSTLANVLLVGYYAKQQSQLNQLPVPSDSVVALAESSPSIRRSAKDASSASPLLPIPVIHPVDLESSLALPDVPVLPVIAHGQSRQNRRERNSPKKPVLDLRHAYSAQRACSSDCRENGCPHNSCSDDCAHIDCSRSANGINESISISRGNQQVNAFALLHMLVHPGCNSPAHNSAESCCGGAHAKQENLNMSAAMLHLIADVVRGITILISAILIQTGVVKNAGQADAWCALLVAAFILFGSLAIFQRVANSVCKTNS
mmetsp:Transcript_94049/g.146994  ORF Transcript_94049/g.146994 Transcript_94049/m.146994 type:complete len:438 (-) Transcript_94049:5-1318(-)